MPWDLTVVCEWQRSRGKYYPSITATTDEVSVKYEAEEISEDAGRQTVKQTHEEWKEQIDRIISGETREDKIEEQLENI